MEAIKLCNLIENAVNYGKLAKVTLETDDSETIITIADQVSVILLL